MLLELFAASFWYKGSCIIDAIATCAFPWTAARSMLRSYTYVRDISCSRIVLNLPHLFEPLAACGQRVAALLKSGSGGFAADATDAIDTAANTQKKTHENRLSWKSIKAAICLRTNYAQR